MMKKYLTDCFKYNDWANCKLLETIQQLSDKAESIKLFSHLITAQDKWMNRITKANDDNAFSWLGAIFPIEQLAQEWNRSINAWMHFMEALTDAQLENEIVFLRATDGKKMGVKIKDLALQLNYHSIHHRAQINKLISHQGITPPATDYIFTVLKEL